ncbi:MAG: ADP-ribosylation factor-like protein, partial [Promethearchaeota archaeon]
MLRQVFITLDREPIYKREFGKALDKSDFVQVFKQISKEASKIATAENIQYHDYFKYRISYLSVPDKNLIFFFVSDLSDKFSNVKKELMKCRREFLDMFGEILDEKLDEDTFEIFDPTIDLIHKNLRPKISLIGFSGVGKTTITRLITADDIPMEHIPTITGDIGTIKIGKLHFHLWDFAGQEQFSFLWNNFIKGSDAVLLITDSTLENCEKSKYFIELIKKEAPLAHTAVIGNKQDLPDAMPIIDIERHLNMKCYSMIATDPANRDKMITIIGDILEMSGEISPLLKPLIERDRKMIEAEEAIEKGDFKLGMKIFEELADLSLDLGDDRVSQDFHEKAQKIRSILKKTQPVVSQPP